MMTDDELLELTRWRLHVDQVLEEALLYRQTTALRMAALEKNLALNTSMTEDMHAGLADAIPILLDLKGFGRTVRRAGEMLKPVAAVGASIGAVVLWVKTGKWPL